MHNQLAMGRKLRILTVVDAFSRLSPVIDPRFTYHGEDMVQVLERTCRKIGYPNAIRVDQRSEFISRDLDLWAYQHNARFSELGVPQALIEACGRYARRYHDGLPIIIPLGWSIWRDQGSSQGDIAHGLPGSDLSDKIPLYAMDPLHTRIGREAMALWLRDQGRRVPWSSHQLPITVWNFESAASDQTLAWQWGEVLRAQAHRVDLLARDLPVEEHSVIRAWLDREYAGLNSARRSV